MQIILTPVLYCGSRESDRNHSWVDKAINGCLGLRYSIYFYCHRRDDSGYQLLRLRQSGRVGLYYILLVKLL